MQQKLNPEDVNFKQALFASYANVAITEMRLYNTDENHSRPSIKELVYLYCIWTNEGCTASDLVELFSTSKALVSQTIIAMEEKGYIIREKDPKDNRRQILSISPNWKIQAYREKELFDNAIRALSGKYTPEEIERAATIICTFTDNVRKEAVDITKETNRK
jgi:DNA-binding MarR family transcriptional regulator